MKAKIENGVIGKNLKFSRNDTQRPELRTILSRSGDDGNRPYS